MASPGRFIKKALYLKQFARDVINIFIPVFLRFYGSFDI